MIFCILIFFYIKLFGFINIFVLNGLIFFVMIVLDFVICFVCFRYFLFLVLVFFNFKFFYLSCMCFFFDFKLKCKELFNYMVWINDCGLVVKYKKIVVLKNWLFNYILWYIIILFKILVCNLIIYWFWVYFLNKVFEFYLLWMDLFYFFFVI